MTGQVLLLSLITHASFRRQPRRRCHLQVLSRPTPSQDIVSNPTFNIFPFLLYLNVSPFTLGFLFCFEISERGGPVSTYLGRDSERRSLQDEFEAWSSKTDLEWFPGSNFMYSPHQLREFHFRNQEFPAPPRMLNAWQQAWEDSKDEYEDLQDDTPMLTLLRTSFFKRGGNVMAL
jgi:hypothetical protein